MNVKPTLKEPVNKQSKNFEKNFNNVMKQDHIQLQEVDDLLTEKEQSLKKKIFSLAKMESLVFSDPKLTKVYDEMAENGEEKYGYHYNETIMNMIFNDYVLNSPKYLQKYKMAIPKKKKRRDKSGINQLKKAANPEEYEKRMKAKSPEEYKSEIQEENIEEEKPTKVVFLIHKDDPDVYAYFPDEDYSESYKMGYSHTGQHTAISPAYANESRLATPEEYNNLKNELETIGYVLDVENEKAFNGGCLR